MDLGINRTTSTQVPVFTKIRIVFSLKHIEYYTENLKRISADTNTDWWGIPIPQFLSFCSTTWYHLYCYYMVSFDSAWSEFEHSWSQTSEGQECNSAQSFHSVAPVTMVSWDLACYPECNMGDLMWAGLSAPVSRAPGLRHWGKVKQRPSAQLSGMTWQTALGRQIAGFFLFFSLLSQWDVVFCSLVGIAYTKRLLEGKSLLRKYWERHLFNSFF